jgi:hypothetical protein
MVGTRTLRMVNAGSGLEITCIPKADTLGSKVKDAGEELHSFVKINEENRAQLDQWIGRLKSMSDSGVCSLAYIDGFTDEYGNRARTTKPFLAHLLGITLPTQVVSGDLDEQLWWSIVSSGGVPNKLSSGPSLTAHSNDAAIEHWTQVELCALHALWHLNLRSPNQSALARLTEAGVWLMNELQPDNAINRPWGIPVFVYLSVALESETDRSTASMYAQTLAHNCCISLGKPDILSACILHDSATSLVKLSRDHTG